MSKKYLIYLLLILSVVLIACDKNSTDIQSTNENVQDDLYTNDVNQESENIKIKQEDTNSHNSSSMIEPQKNK